MGRDQHYSLGKRLSQRAAAKSTARECITRRQGGRTISERGSRSVQSREIMTRGCASDRVGLMSAFSASPSVRVTKAAGMVMLRRNLCQQCRVCQKQLLIAGAFGTGRW